MSSQLHYLRAVGSCEVRNDAEGSQFSARHMSFQSVITSCQKRQCFFFTFTVLCVVNDAFYGIQS